MSAILYLTPTLETALAHIIEHVRRVRRDRPLAALDLLAALGDTIRQLRLVLGNVIAVRFLQFYNLSSSVLSEAGSASTADERPGRRDTSSAGSYRKCTDRGQLLPS